MRNVRIVYVNRLSNSDESAFMDVLTPKNWFAAPAAALLLLASGCNRQADNAAVDNELALAPPTVTANAAAESPSARLRTAAEPFEALTEQSFRASWSGIDRLIAEARTAVATARTALPAATRVAVDARLSAITRARQSQDRPALALAAVETYRQLVEAQDPAAAEPPVAVSLMDYAGFRFDALAQAPTVDWAAMREAARFARRQWDTISPSITSNALKGVTTQSVDAMNSAVDARNVSFARSAAATELAMVDLLEEHVAANRTARRN